MAVVQDFFSQKQRRGYAGKREQGRGIRRN
jgi:hypothetical protein